MSWRRLNPPADHDVVNVVTDTAYERRHSSKGVGDLREFHLAGGQKAQIIHGWHGQIYVISLVMRVPKTMEVIVSLPVQGRKFIDHVVIKLIFATVGLCLFEQYPH